MISFEDPRTDQGTLTRYRASSVGFAAWSELSVPRVSLSVHSVFASSVNLKVGESGRLVALTGPSGRVYPHAVVLERPVDFRTWRLATGSSARLVKSFVRMDGQGITVVVDLNRALRGLPRSLPPIVRFTNVCHTCATRLTEIQAREQFDLRLDALRDPGRPVPKEGEALRQAALALGASARTLARADEPGFCPDSRARLADIRSSVSSLVGLGTGLTPSGDDFLCGFMLAARARFCGEPLAGRELLRALCVAVEEDLGSTGEISASLLRSMIQGHWPEPLLDLADAIAADRDSEVLQALEDLCRLGHSSGADIATGFLFGLEILPDRGIETSVRSLTNLKAPAAHRRSRCATQPPLDRRPDFLGPPQRSSALLY
jgi:hypothetical protein